jgi:hypothetical protein
LAKLKVVHLARKIIELQYNPLLDINIKPQIVVEDFKDNQRA